MTIPDEQVRKWIERLNTAVKDHNLAWVALVIDEMRVALEGEGDRKWDEAFADPRSPAMLEKMASEALSREEVERWAAVRGDDAGRLARALLAAWDEIGEYDDLENLRRTREKPWIEKWRAHTGEVDTLPDYGALLDFIGLPLTCGHHREMWSDCLDRCSACLPIEHELGRLRSRAETADEVIDEIVADLKAERDRNLTRELDALRERDAAREKIRRMVEIVRQERGEGGVNVSEREVGGFAACIRILTAFRKLDDA